jgi:hypothetical protein
LRQRDSTAFFDAHSIRSQATDVQLSIQNVLSNSAISFEASSEQEDGLLDVKENLLPAWTPSIVNHAPSWAF